jgi:hypothetical protein
MEYIERIADIAISKFENGRHYMTFTQLGKLLGMTPYQAGGWVGQAWHHYADQGDTYTASCIMFVFRYKSEDGKKARV